MFPSQQQQHETLTSTIHNTLEREKIAITFSLNVTCQSHFEIFNNLFTLTTLTTQQTASSFTGEYTILFSSIQSLSLSICSVLNGNMLSVFTLIKYVLSCELIALTMSQITCYSLFFKCFSSFLTQNEGSTTNSRVLAFRVFSSYAIFQSCKKYPINLPYEVIK